MNFVLSFLLLVVGPNLEFVEMDEDEDLLVLDETRKVIGFIDGEEEILGQEVEFDLSEDSDAVED